MCTLGTVIRRRGRCLMPLTCGTTIPTLHRPARSVGEINRRLRLSTCRSVGGAKIEIEKNADLERCDGCASRPTGLGTTLGGRRARISASSAPAAGKLQVLGGGSFQCTSAGLHSAGGVQTVQSPTVANKEAALPGASRVAWRIGKTCYGPPVIYQPRSPTSGKASVACSRSASSRPTMATARASDIPSQPVACRV